MQSKRSLKEATRKVVGLKETKTQDSNALSNAVTLKAVTLKAVAKRRKDWSRQRQRVTLT